VDATVIGSAAAVLTTAAFLPQVARTLRTRSAGDISWGYLALFIAGIGCWFTYGLVIRDLPIAASNAVVLTCTLLVAGVKTRERRRAARVLHRAVVGE
jgi:MtN3 and saliva related transmembrane protein